MAAGVRLMREARLPGESRGQCRPGLYVALAGLLTSAIFTFVVYPGIASPAGAVLDPDGYGALGWGLWKLQTFSYFPSSQPSVSRGPLYPLVIAMLLKISGGWWPYCVQAAQCVWFGLTCLLTFEIGRRLWNLRVGTIAGAICAVHPFLVWYTSRIWIEAMAMLLFTAIVAAVLYFQEKPALSRAVLLGVVVGAACLCKGTFLPFLVALPMLLWMVRPKHAGARAILCIGLVPVLMILPWSARNWTLTQTIIPVHGQMGFNLHVGDSFVAHFAESPWAFPPLWDIATAKAAALARPALGQGFDGWQAEIAVNSILLQASLQRYRADPLFLARKILLQAVTFWMWSETKLKTLLVGMLQLPLLLAFLVSVAAIVRKGQLRTIRSVPVALVLFFYVCHLPVLAAARYSAVLVPTMLAYSVGGVLERWAGISCEG